MTAGYHLLVIIVGFAAIWRGWRIGFGGMIPALLGLSFGAVCAHIFAEPAQSYTMLAMPWLQNSWAKEYIITNVANSGVYLLVYLLFSCLTSLFRTAFSLMSKGILNSLFGAGMCLLSWMVLVSIFLNMTICHNPESALVKCAGDSDANLAGVTLLLSSNLIGATDAEQLAHQRQLRDARIISKIYPESHIPKKSYNEVI